MNDKQQLQAMGEHQAEQHMCMAKQIEDLQARLQECANGAAKMQEQRDYAYKMMGKFGGERDELARQLEAEKMKSADIAELLPGHVSGVGEKALPEGWKLIEKATCFALVNDGQVIATMAGPAAEDTAAILAAVLAAAKPEPTK